MEDLKLGDLVYNQFEFKINSTQNDIFKIISFQEQPRLFYECVNITTGNIRIFPPHDIIIFDNETYNNQKLFKKKILKVLKKAFLLQKSLENLESEMYYLGFTPCSLSDYNVAKLIPQLINNCRKYIDQNLFLSGME